MSDDRITVRVPADTLAAVDGARGDVSRTAFVLTAIERELLGAHVAPLPPVPLAATPAAPGALVAGEPSPGVVCAGPACWERSTRRYGLRRVPLCVACAAALAGEVFRRSVPAAGRKPA